jgi:hypothetical protein
LPIWIDELGPDNISTWRKDFTSADARDVINAVGAWIYVFRRPVSQDELGHVKDAMKTVQKAIEKASGFSWDGTCLAVATKPAATPSLEKSVEDWERLCQDHGFEYVDVEAKGKNEFGEMLGVPRIREALEATDWTSEPDLLDLGDFGDDDDEDLFGGFAGEEREMGLELLGVKGAIAKAETGDAEDDPAHQDEQVEELTRMMTKMQAIKG